MTVGSVTQRYYSKVPATPEIGDHTSGSFYTKTWNGGDWPKPFVHYTELQLPDIETYRYVWNPSLRKKEKVLWSKSSNNHKRVYEKPVKRSYSEWHPYTMSCLKSRSHSGLRYKQNSSGPWINSSVFCPLGSTVCDSMVDPWTDNDTINLIGRLRTKISGSSFNAGIFLGESKESVKTIASVANRIYRAGKALKRGNVSLALREIQSYVPYRALTKGVDTVTVVNGKTFIRSLVVDAAGRRRYTSKPWDPNKFNGRRVPARIAGTTLEVNYAIVPLLQDVEDAAKFMAHQYSAPLQHKVTASLQRAEGKKENVYSSFYPDSQTHYFKMRGTPVISKGKITCFLRERNVIALSGLTDVASVAWELVPFSFVADWFIPIGNYLDARGLTQQLDGSTYVITKTLKRTVVGPVYDNGFGYIIDPAHNEKEGVCEDFKITRSAVLLNLAIPLPQQKPLGQTASWAHAINAVSLLVSNFSS
jgi:hypothetical protein